MRPFALVVLVACTHAAAPRASVATRVAVPPSNDTEEHARESEEPVSHEEIARRLEALPIVSTEHVTISTRTREPRVVLGDIGASRGISATTVRRVLARNVEPMLDCYLTAIREGDVGFAHVEVLIGAGASGETIFAEGRTATASPAMAMCVEDALRQLRFPPAGTPLRAVNAALFFQPGGGRK